MYLSNTSSHYDERPYTFKVWKSSYSDLGSKEWVQLLGKNKNVLH